MTRDEAKAAAAWAEAHDKALSHYRNRLRRRDVIRQAFSDHEKPDCTISVKHRAFDNYGNPRTFDLSVPASMARDWLLTDIAQQIARARIAAVKAGVSESLLTEASK